MATGVEVILILVEGGDRLCSFVFGWVAIACANAPGHLPLAGKGW